MECGLSVMGVDGLPEAAVGPGGEPEAELEPEVVAGDVDELSAPEPEPEPEPVPVPEPGPDPSVVDRVDVSAGAVDADNPEIVAGEA
jgi:hypothetical protein